MLSPLFFSKKLKELKVVSVTLGIAFSLFFLGFVYQLATNGTSMNPDFSTPKAPNSTSAVAAAMDKRNYFAFKAKW